MKVLIIAGYTPSLVNFRGDLIREMVGRGHEVISSAPEEGYEEEIAALGARFIRLPVERTGTNPINDIKLIFAIRNLIINEKPDTVLGYTIKPVIYGSIAARLAGIKDVYSMLTGLGYVFTVAGFQACLFRILCKILFFISFKCCSKIFFQNPDDIEQFVSFKIINKSKCVLVNGSGVNLERFKPFRSPSQMTFLMISRLIRDKGVIEYLEAARIVKEKYPVAIFQLVGPFDINPSSLKYDQIKEYVNDGTVEYLGEVQDVRPFIQACRIYVLPSYREGTPRTVLEAMAIGRPIITTDAPGCRETVKNGDNGFLVPQKNVGLLAEKMLWMIEHPEETDRMGGRSLEICREKYDVNKVNRLIIDTMRL